MAEGLTRDCVTMSSVRPTSMRSTVAPTRLSLRLRRKKGPRDETTRRAKRHANRSRQLTRRSPAGRAHRTRTPPDARRAHRAPPRRPAATARRAPHRRPRPTGAAQRRPASQTNPPTNGPPSTGDPRAAGTQRSEQRRIPPATEDDDRDARETPPPGPQRASHATRARTETSTRPTPGRRQGRAPRRTRRQPLPQRGRERTAGQPDRGRASRNHGLDHGESREAPEARARRIPGAEDRDPRRSATHRQRLQRQRIPASSAADRERGTRGSREDTTDHAADERAEARRQLPRTTETDSSKHKTPPSERTPPPETPAADEDAPQARKPKPLPERRRSG